MIDRRSLSFIPAHLAGVVLMQSTSWSLLSLLPVLARKHFDANNWQTLVITAAPVVLYSLAVFWNHIFNHMSFRRYLACFWIVASAPLLFIPLVTDVWSLIALHVIASAGGAGMPLASGNILKHLYPAEKRGKIYSVVWASSLLCGALISFGLGEWLTASEEAFRIFMPLTAILQGLGALIFIGLSDRTGGDSAREISDRDLLHVRSIVEPVTHMREVLRNDHNFARYEAAYMTYGIGWMIAAALLPALVTDRLHLPYDSFANSTHVSYLIGMVILLFPAGMLMDRVGAAKSTGLSFLLLGLYPIGLIFADDADSLWWVSLYYGLSHCGASVGWMLGPVSFAPSPDKVPQYVAIHATFVGIRGKLFQALGVFLYELTHDFTIPFIVAALSFVWSAWQMFALDRRMRPKPESKPPDPSKDQTNEGSGGS